MPSDIWGRTQPLTETRYSVQVGQGALHFDRLSPPAATPPEPGAAWLGFGYERAPAYAGVTPPLQHIGDVFAVFVPYWFILLATAALPLWRGYVLLRSKYTILSGHCRACGYDLRAAPEQCPECGTLVRSAV